MENKSAILTTKSIKTLNSCFVKESNRKNRHFFKI